MSATDFAFSVTTKHSRDLHYACFVDNDIGVGGGDRADSTLAHDDMVMRACRDLRDV